MSLACQDSSRLAWMRWSQVRLPACEGGRGGRQIKAQHRGSGALWEQQMGTRCIMVYNTR
jgi:hypothetical protein